MAFASKKNTKLADTLRVLGSGVRIQILEFLLRNEGEHNVSAIQSTLKISQSALSQNLSMLKMKGFVISKVHKQERLYSIKDQKIREYLESIFSLY